MKIRIRKTNRLRSGKDYNPKSIFRSKFIITNQCWLWVGSKTANGYGHFTFKGKDHSAHRFSYEQHKGDIPKGLQIDHLCRNRSCVNPSHLEAVTPRENIVRGGNVIKKKSTLPIGVYKNYTKFQARKGFFGCDIHIGNFSTPEDASIAYQTAVIV